METVENEELARFVYARVEHKGTDTFEQWREKAIGWELRPIYNNTKILVAVILIKANMVHVATHPDHKGRWCRRDEFFKIGQDIINKYGEMLTCLDINDLTAMDVINRLGFEPTTVQFTMRELKKRATKPVKTEVKMPDNIPLELAPAVLPYINGNFIDKLYQLESGFKQMPQIEVPEKFFFAKGVCVKEVVLPKGSFIISRMHRHSGVNTISKGDVSVLADPKEGWKRFKGPCTFESPEHTKRAIYVHEETVWSNQLVTEETDPVKLKALWTIDSHQEYLAIKEKRLIGETL